MQAPKGKAPFRIVGSRTSGVMELMTNGTDVLTIISSIPDFHRPSRRMARRAVGRHTR